MIQICIGIFCIVIGLIALERKNKLPRSPFLVKVGGWSYAMYLTHVPIILGTFKVMGQADPLLMFAISMVLTLIVSSLVGTLDVACYYRLKRWVDQYPTLHKWAAATFLAVFVTSGVVGLYKA